LNAKAGEVPEWLNGAVSKTVERVSRSEGSNPSLSAIFEDVDLKYPIVNLQVWIVFLIFHH
jgi:hypothetical protein